jgi:hypothetical protein
MQFPEQGLPRKADSNGWLLDNLRKFKGFSLVFEDFHLHVGAYNPIFVEINGCRTKQGKRAIFQAPTG